MLNFNACRKKLKITEKVELIVIMVQFEELQFSVGNYDIINFLISFIIKMTWAFEQM